MTNNTATQANVNGSELRFEVPNAFEGALSFVKKGASELRLYGVQVLISAPKKSSTV